MRPASGPPRLGRSPEGSDEPGLLRSSAQIAGITGLARIAGFARWIVLGLTVGTTYLGNTYQTANWVPNIVFELAAGGVLSAVFVPTFVSELERGRDRGLEVASSLANTFLLLSLPIVVVGLVAAEPIMRAMTIGVQDAGVRAQQIELGAWFLRFFVPQVPLYVIAMVLTGVLHTHKRFILPAAAPLFSSLVVIGSYLAFQAMGPGADLGDVSRAQLFVLAGGTTGGVFVLAFSQLPQVLRLGVRWKPVLRWRDPAVRQAIKAGGYGVAFFAVHEVGLLTTLVLANRVEGGVVAWQVAYAFFELPNALIGLPVAIALFPSLSERFVRRDEGGYAALLSRGYRGVTFLAVPAAAGLFVLAPSIAEGILGRGDAPEAGPELVGAALRTLALGIPAWALVQTLTRSFYARHRTAPPVAANGVAMGTYAALAVPLTLLLAPAGGRALEVLGYTYAGGQWVGIAVGTLLLARAVRGWSVGADVRSFVANVIRSGVMAGVVWAVVGALGGADPLARSALGLGAGLAIYGLLSIRSPELRSVLPFVLRRGRR